MEWFTYLLKVSACTALFFAFYLLVLRKLTFFKINRFYLLGSLVLSFIIPALQFTIEREVAQSTAIEQPTVLQNVDLGGAAFTTPIVVGAGTGDVEVEPFDWYGLLPYLYTAIVVGLLAVAAWRLFQLYKHTRTKAHEVNGLKLVAKSVGFTNCSFFNYVFIDQNSLTETELQVLLRHEEVHAKQLHSIDKILLMLAKAVLWFNPIIYLYDKALEQTHEYEADEATSLNVGTEHYAHLLLKLAVSKNTMPLIHNFVKSPIKERIKMLFNSKSKNMKKFMYLLALPIGLGLLWGFTVDVVDVFPKVKTATGNEFTLILDAGHGGKESGAEMKGYKEKDITLTFTKKIKALAEAKGIKVVTTRNSDEKISLADRLKPQGDFLLSIHVNSEPIKTNGSRNGIEMYTPTSDKKLNWFKSTSMTYGLYQNLKTVDGIKTGNKPIQKKLFLLQNSNAAGLVLEMGYLTNEQDLKTITNEAKQNELAEAIVNGILHYKEFLKTDKEIESQLNGETLQSPPKPNQNQPLNKKASTTSKDGQKGESVAATVYPKPVIISSSNISVDTKYDVSYLKNAVISIGENRLKGEEIAFDKRNERLTAKNAQLKLKGGIEVAEKYIIYDVKKGTYITNKTPGSTIQVNSDAYELVTKLKADNDSLQMYTIMDKTLVVSGKVKSNIGKFSYIAKVVTVDKSSNIMTIHAGTLTTPEGYKISGDKIEYNALLKTFTVTEPLGSVYK
ncbi:MAG: N-acetylmuramoyl-L-alanine amidase [Pedobacter sp.]|jgi:N-acetylmuramoyl-L-alanine amidase|uniref:N-acetylmuramoyl-L-alanine amidase n=1 Tax=Pedobacter sp. TaxID=1411316 RepID=UPI0035699466